MSRAVKITARAFRFGGWVCRLGLPPLPDNYYITLFSGACPTRNNPSRVDCQDRLDGA